MGSNKYQCHFCPEVFNTHSELFKHQRSKHVKKSTTLVCQCAICGMEFLDYDSKTSHVHKNHPEFMDRLFQVENKLANDKASSLPSASSTSASNPYKQKENNSKQTNQQQKSKIAESNSFLATLLK